MRKSGIDAGPEAWAGWRGGEVWAGVGWRGLAWAGVGWRGLAWAGVGWRGLAWAGGVRAQVASPPRLTARRSGIGSLSFPISCRRRLGTAP
ncbi:hypothetical protein J2S03_000453 [Alicyclobacillus cycloheptanicus]|uniref:Uncharacterized protein n=1 Tax=Alicyclobacillus cycloheptanicus TaxID=1457 RepID=A0ABT9XFW0_9BACL|nr:hypothetical protein [Alicyclobacillus cycloheptanicus]